MLKTKEWYRKIREGKYASLVQFIKFGIVGASNSVIYYGIEMLSFYILFMNANFSTAARNIQSVGISIDGDKIKIFIVTAIAFVISVLNSYFWNSRYVFRLEGNRESKQHIFAFLRMTLCYAITGLIISPIVKILLSNAGTVYWLASLIAMILMIPLNFILNKFWAFKKG